MDPRLLRFYTQELAHVRESAAEFASRFPKIASRLAMDTTEVQDPYVERLLEGFAFLTARVQLRLHEEFPRFTEQLLNRVSPNFLAPVPAMGVVQFNPVQTDAALKQGVKVHAGTVLQSQVAKGIQTPCKFRVAHSFTLWPLSVTQVAHRPLRGMFSNNDGQGVLRSALHISIANTTKTAMSKLPLDMLDFHVSCGDEYAFTLFDRFCYRTAAICIRTPGEQHWHPLPLENLQPLGLDADEALLPADTAQFSGARLLQEFFAYPQRYLFFRIRGLRPYLSCCDQSSFELALCFPDSNPELDRVVGMGTLALNCTPVVNLFEQSCDRALLDARLHEVHVQPNRSKPCDFEVHSIIAVQGHGKNKVCEVSPLYSQPEDSDPSDPKFMYRRVPTKVSDRQSREGGRSSYIGSEVYLGLTLPAGELTTAHGLEHLAIKALCTNRDLPLLMPLGQGPTDLAWPGSLPLQSVRFLRGPSRPKPPIQTGQSCWQLIEHLSLNYLGLIDDGHSRSQGGAATLNQLLSLYADLGQPAHQKITSAVESVLSQVAVLRIVRQGRPAVARGLQVKLILNEHALQGTGLTVLGSVLARYLASHVSVNSFVVTQVRGSASGVVVDFPPMSGNRPLL